MTFQS